MYGCGRPYFEGLLQHSSLSFCCLLSCGRPYFEGLLQQQQFKGRQAQVVEDLVLKGYYNIAPVIWEFGLVVEDLVLKGYYNYKIDNGLNGIVVEDLVLKGYYNNILIISL